VKENYESDLAPVLVNSIVQLVIQHLMSHSDILKNQFEQPLVTRETGIIRRIPPLVLIYSRNTVMMGMGTHE
jgi:hypothetical protein